jgi:hypothetical protein
MASGRSSRSCSSSIRAPEAAAKGTGLVLLTLAAGQFLMTLDSSVMNVSIATVAKDVGTTVTGIQTAITLYTLVMAMLMITGGRSARSSAAGGPSPSAAWSMGSARFVAVGVCG